MTKYDLPDLGYKYKGVSSIPSYKTKLGPWTIIDIPKDVNETEAINFVKGFINNICAVEIPTSLVCNLRCRYCYVSDPRFKNKQVSTEIVKKILLELRNLFPGFSENRKKDIYLSPWGAEPLANIPTLEVMQEFGREFYPNSYHLSTSTNGTIWNDRLKNLFSKLIDDGAFSSIQVSLDGPKELQDYQRPDFKGNGSYDKIESFCKNLFNLAKEKGLKNRPYSFCSTIHLVDDKFEENWSKAARFFSEPNQWYTNIPHMPSRMSGEDLSKEEDINKFINAQKLMYEVVLERAEQGITFLDFYTMKLFSKSSSIRSRNAFPYCSALNTQIGVDIDGSLYPCHAPITSPQYKAFMWYGNLFEKIISYKQLMRNYSYQYGTLWTKGKCKSCPIYQFADGNICWSCPGHNLAISGEPSIDSALKCIAFQESFKYWIAIAKITLDNPNLANIPKNWFNDIKVPDNLPNKKTPVNYGTMHYDCDYEGLTVKALDKWFGHNPDHEKIQLIDDWWVFDNFKEICDNGSCNS
jgi:uncharacterized protein